MVTLDPEKLVHMFFVWVTALFFTIDRHSKYFFLLSMVMYKKNLDFKRLYPARQFFRVQLQKLRVYLPLRRKLNAWNLPK